MVTNLLDFIEKADLVKPKGFNEGDKGCIWAYIWDDYSKLREYMETNKNVYIYTIITELNKDYLLTGKWHINRLGYILTNNYIELEDDSIQL